MSAPDSLGLHRVRRALLSVSDKTGIVDFARGLARHGDELVSTGGTRALLREHGLEVREVRELTGAPEMMDGRVKTLHPVIHGGILGVEAIEDHARAMREHGIAPIDLVCVNLYPFECAAEAPGASVDELIEQIDIGGPSMLRSAAKNHARVTVACDPEQYPALLGELNEHGGAIALATRRRCAYRAFERCAGYDRAISNALGERFLEEPVEQVVLSTIDALRYGENPHQEAFLARPDGAHDTFALSNAGQLHGKELSYNNLNDASSALALAWELHRLGPTRAHAVVVKHTNPCGACSAGRARDAIGGALAGDPLAAYGGIVVTNRVLDEDDVEPLCAGDVFLEVIVAPAFTEEALTRLRAKSAYLRLLEIGAFPSTAPVDRHVRSLVGRDLLLQDADVAPIDVSTWTHAAGPPPDDAMLTEAVLAWACAKHLTSNAIGIGGRIENGSIALHGAGAGQMDRVAACRIAVMKAGARARGAVAASDAFFPFADGPEVLIEGGVRCIVQPGGSKRDAETFALCDARGVTCLTTGRRHFRH